MPNLVLLAGIPGSGKSTFAKTFFDLKYAIISSDEIRQRLAGSLREAHQQKLKPWDVFYSEIEERLVHGVDVIADATFLTTSHRDRGREVAERTKSAVHLVLFKNWLDADRRNNERDEDRRVPAKVMHDMMNLLWDTLARLPQEQYTTVTKIEAFS